MKNHTFIRTIGLLVTVCAATILAGCDMPLVSNNLIHGSVDGDGNPLTSVTIPGDVRSLSVAAEAGMARFSWADPEDEDFDHIEISCVEPEDGFAPVSVAGGDQTVEISGLQNDALYDALIQTVDSDDNKSAGVRKSVYVRTDPLPAEVMPLPCTAGLSPVTPPEQGAAVCLSTAAPS
jgi:hypothetical protein